MDALVDDLVRMILDGLLIVVVEFDRVFMERPVDELQQILLRNLVDWLVVTVGIEEVSAVIFNA
jgi:hypothetical protein